MGVVGQCAAGDLGAIEEVRTVAIRANEIRVQTRDIPREVPVALSYNGTTHAVMMATPSDLEDFATGFSLTEGVVKAPGEIESFEVVRHPDGIDLQIWLRAKQADALFVRRRRLAGPTGCGLCGIESIDSVLPHLPAMSTRLHVEASSVHEAMNALARMQKLHLKTAATHAAGFFVPGEGLLALREDVGRHNALDKLVGGLARGGISGAHGMAVLTSRVSVEMVQKAASFGISAIAAISVPTALAVRLARQAGITLIAVVRPDGFEVFTQPDAFPE